MSNVETSLPAIVNVPLIVPVKLPASVADKVNVAVPVFTLFVAFAV